MAAPDFATESVQYTARSPGIQSFGRARTDFKWWGQISGQEGYGSRPPGSSWCFCFNNGKERTLLEGLPSPQCACFAWGDAYIRYITINAFVVIYFPAVGLSVFYSRARLGLDIEIRTYFPGQ